ncbi:gamma-glutamylcyclotransferase-like [Harmonia axyridis]|uniref:gamma-glutamylcyclotransferase-like n=1 Tax=Harmonia axyridis TaxID=115357 RepID=UPI001E279BDF|nr:gamma-glutamylcyclotransferase-like [Harmonia axyridis]
MTNTHDKFLYFAYGSNLLQQRIHIKNPSAERAGIAKLKNYRLDFNTYSNKWKGAVATITKKEGDHVWGALWTLNKEHMETLDKQESVPVYYTPVTVDVETSSGETKSCRVYIQTNNPEAIEKIEDLPHERQPSYAYLKTILEGAKESNLPIEYKKFLEKIPHNGYKGEVEIPVKLNNLN